MIQIIYDFRSSLPISNFKRLHKPVSLDRSHLLLGGDGFGLLMTIGNFNGLCKAVSRTENLLISGI